LEQSFADGHVQGAAQGGADALQGRRGHRGAGSGRLRGDGGEHGLDVPGPQPGEWVAAEVRDQVAAYVDAVAGGRRPADPAG
jgi:hypothetical protein